MRGHIRLLIGLLLLTVTGAAQAQEAPTIQARAGVHPDFDRVVFDWPQTVAYHVQREGDRVTVSFDAKAQPHFVGFSFLTRARGFVPAADGNGNLTVSFSVDANAVLKDFTSEHSVVIDIEGAPAKIAKKAEAEPAAPAPVPVAAPAPVAAAPAPTPPPVAVKAPEPKPAETKAPEPAPAVTASAPVVTEPAVPAPAVEPAPVPAAAPIPPVAAAPVAISPARAAALANLPEITDTPLLAASLDPRTTTRAAVWQRGGYGMIVFDRKLTLSADTLTAGQPASRVPLEALDLPKASGFRFPMPADAEIRATRTGTIWKIFLSRQRPDVPVSTLLVAQPDFALGSRFLMPLPDAPEPVHMADPVVGDELIIVPLEQTQAFSVSRRMADFQILPAAQGLVLKPLTDKIVVRSVSDGIEITAEGGLRLSSALDTGATQQSPEKAKAAAAGKSMFDFATWRGKPEETFTKTRQRLQQTIVDVPERERNRARLELARFYFAQGYGEEAVGMLKWLAKQVPDLMAHADFLALIGASEVLAYHPEEGLKDFDTPLLAGQPEIELWQAVAHAEMRSWAEAEEKFSVTETMLAGYPEPFYSRFSVLAIEAALAAGRDHEGADWIDRFAGSPHSAKADVAITYLRGVLHAKSGRAMAAEQAWKEVAASNDHLYKIRAEMALIDLGVANGSLSAAQAADRLEAMRFGWRGDDLEVDILHRLGQFYIQAKNVKAGLAILSQAVQLYPDSPLTPKIKDEMAQIFHDVFLADLGKNLSALDALTLYQQYRNLMPSGADGAAVTRNLAERLVAIDLLEQSGDLLEDLVKNKLQGTEKARISSRLAAIRLLDHKPDAAISALDLVGGNDLPADLQAERTLLRAKALSELRKDNEALALLQGNDGNAAKLLRADITMHAQRWGDAAKALLDLIGPPPKAGTVLRPEQADWLVNCAIAYSLAGDQTGLDRLAIDYGAAMAGQPQNDTFRVLTQPEKLGQLHDITAAQGRITDVDMFQGFLNNYRKAEQVGGTAPAVKAP